MVNSPLTTVTSYQLVGKCIRNNARFLVAFLLPPFGVCVELFEMVLMGLRSIRSAGGLGDSLFPYCFWPLEGALSPWFGAPASNAITPTSFCHHISFDVSASFFHI